MSEQINTVIQCSRCGTMKHIQTGTVCARCVREQAQPMSEPTPDALAAIRTKWEIEKCQQFHQSFYGRDGRFESCHMVRVRDVEPLFDTLLAQVEHLTQEREHWHAHYDAAHANWDECLKQLAAKDAEIARWREALTQIRRMASDMEDEHPDDPLGADIIDFIDALAQPLRAQADDDYGDVR